MVEITRRGSSNMSDIKERSGMVWVRCSLEKVSWYQKTTVRQSSSYFASVFSQKIM